jgi:TusE/DsrC/DsvC family sulfur relay protein
MEAQNNSTEARLERLEGRLDRLLEAQERQQEFLEEMSPIAKAVMEAGTEKLAAAEEVGWFRFGSGAVEVAEAVVQHTSEEDLDQLRQGIVPILETVRQMTRPEVLKMLDEVASVIHRADELEPVGAFGLAGATQDADVQRGIAVMIEILREVGRGSKGLKPRGRRGRRRGLEARMAPRRAVEAAPAQRKQAPVAARAGQPEPLAGETVLGVVFDAGGFVEDPTQWTEELAVEIGKRIGVEQLEADHWTAIKWARASYLEHGKSPNIRAITKGSGVSTKRLYALFAKAPGKATARCAGIPKPAGCI